MGRRVGQSLTVKGANALTEPGMYCDGDGLYLKLDPRGGKSWVLRTTVFGRRRDFGLGSYKLVSLSEARRTAWEMRKIARSGGDPETYRTQRTLTFEEVASMAFDALKTTWTSPRHEKNWWSSLERYVLPKLGAKPIDLIGVQDIHGLLSPIWQTKYETAKQVKHRISSVFQWAKGAGHYHKENPVSGLTKVLLPPKGQAKHHSSMPWTDLPMFMSKLAERDEISARLLEFAILTCTRSGEARGARWDEIEGETWVIPARRMKGRLEHRIPMAPKSLAILEQVSGAGDVLIFPNSQRHKRGNETELSYNVFSALMKRMGVEGYTTHGFRSTFKDWTRDNAVADNELSEHVLAHKVGNAVERAYARSDLFERRRGLMLEWERYALSAIKPFKVRPRPNRSKR